MKKQQQRLLSKQLITTPIVGEIAPFTKALKGGGEELKSSAMVYVPHLREKIIELLEQHARYKFNSLTNVIQQKFHVIFMSQALEHWYSG